MQVEKSALLSTTYFGPIQYYSKFLMHSQRWIENHEHYIRQTYRNRCNIYGANGILSLSIPVLKDSGHKSKISDIRIDRTKNWKKLHWKGIESAYRHSPFFEFYLDEIRSLFDRDHSFLLDLNTEILRAMLRNLEIVPEFRFTDKYMEFPQDETVDYRLVIHPAKPGSDDPEFSCPSYRQVFMEKHGFLPNLSILDLLFNEGPDAGTILKKSVVPPD